MKTTVFWTVVVCGGGLVLVRGAVGAALAAGISPYTLIYAVPAALAAAVFLALAVLGLVTARPARPASQQLRPAAHTARPRLPRPALQPRTSPPTSLPPPAS